MPAACLSREDPSCFGYHFCSKSRARSANADSKTVAEAVPEACTAARRAGEGSRAGLPEVVAGGEGVGGRDVSGILFLLVSLL